MSRIFNTSPATYTSNIESVLYKLLFFAMVAYSSTIGLMGSPSCLISVGGGVGSDGGSKLFLMITTVMPVVPRFFCAPKNMAEKFLMGIRLERMLEDISATTIGSSSSDFGSKILGNPGNSTPSTVSLSQLQ